MLSYRLDDFDNYVQFHIEANRLDRSGRLISREQLAEELGHPNFEPENNLFIAEHAGHIVGNASVFLEAAIERHGRAPERSVKFNVPYAIASWRDGDEMEILALNHWLDEDAIPIRFLYPSTLGPVPGGNESTVQVRMPVLEADLVVRALVNACNQW